MIVSATESNLKDTLIYLGVLAIGAIGHHLWERYKHRLATLRWSVSLQPMAFGTEDFGWGKVEITYDGSPTKNIQIATVELQNASSVDLENVRVDVLTDAETLVLRRSGALRDSLQPFPFSPAMSAIWKEASQREATPAELAYWNVRSEFAVPVLNRGAIATFKLLLSRSDYATPTVTAYCVHPGSKLEHRPLEEEIMGVGFRRAQRAGILLTLSIAVVATLSPAPRWLAVAVAWLGAAYALRIGAIVIKALRALGALAG